MTGDFMLKSRELYTLNGDIYDMKKADWENLSLLDKCEGINALMSSEIHLLSAGLVVQL
jgi:hypothetical protein